MHVGPRPVDAVVEPVAFSPAHEIARSKRALKFSNAVSGLPREFILMYSSSPEPISSIGSSWKEMAGSSTEVSRSHAICASHAAEALVDRVDHHQHRLDGRIVPPDVQVPGLIDDPRRGIRDVRRRCRRR